MQLAFILLMSVLGRLATFVSVGLAVLGCFWYEMDYLPTFGVAIAAATLNVLLWPKQDVRQRTHEVDRVVSTAKKQSQPVGEKARHE